MTKDKCDYILRSIVGSEELIERWWNSPNQAFQLQKPKDVDIIKVFNYLLDQMEAPH